MVLWESVSNAMEKKKQGFEIGLEFVCVPTIRSSLFTSR